MKINSSGSQTFDSLYHYTLFLLGLSPSDTTSFPVADFIRSANLKLRDLSFLLWRNSSTWEFDDSNQTDLPIATTLLVDGQRDYTIPTTTLSVERVEIKDPNGDYQLISQIDKSDIKGAPMLEYYKDDGMPRYYDIVGNSILLYPTPATGYVTLAAGLRIYVSRDIHEFTLTDTATEPGVPDMFHPYLAFAPAFDYATAKNMGPQRIQALQLGIAKYEKMVSDFTARRNRDKKFKMKPKTKSNI
jgi:hypothetical protein